MYTERELWFNRIERKTTNKGVTMGLDQYAGFRDENGQVKEEFYWRKHARLQQFMAVEFREQNKTKKENNSSESYIS